MDEPKVPSHESSWEAIDIFVFSNGQQHSPPRKYHLRSDELTFWDATLGLLARCQFGSLHSAIHLYTMDGKFIENPMELHNGGAYVAVVPPDTFIEGGYEKYLMKASKSWEKRQARKSSSNEQMSNLDNIQSDKSKSSINKDVNTKTADIEIQTISSAKTEGQDKELEKPQDEATPQQTAQKSFANSIRHIDKRRSTPVEPPATRTSILRKMRANHFTPPVTRKNPNVNAGKGNVKLIPQKLIDTGTVVKGNNKTTTTKLLTPVTDPVPNNVIGIPSFEPEIKSVKISTVTIPNHESQTTDHALVDYAIEDKDIILISNLFKTDDFPSSRDQLSDRIDADAIPPITHVNPNVDPYGQSLKPFIFSNLKPFEPISKKLQSGASHTNIILGNSNIMKIPDVLTIAYNEIRSGNSSKEKLKQGTSSPARRLSDKLAEDNIVTFVNKGDDEYNLKLIIEMKDGDGVVRTIQKDFTHKSRSLSEIKEEQGANNNVNSEMLTQSKSLDSIPTTEHACCNNPKVVVVKCPCDHYHYEDTAKIKKPTEKDAKTYFIIVPIITNGESDRCTCKCNKEVTTTCEKGVQNADSATKLNIISSVKEIVMSVAVTDSEKILKSDCNPDSKRQSVCSRTDKSDYVVTKQQVAIVNGDNQFPSGYVIATQISPKCDESQKTDYVVEIRDNLQTTTCMNVRDVGTQTDWCSVLLEVRRHEDGRYTFHLPPLHVLKHYYASSQF